MSSLKSRINQEIDITNKMLLKRAVLLAKGVELNQSQTKILLKWVLNYVNKKSQSGISLAQKLDIHPDTFRWNKHKILKKIGLDSFNYDLIISALKDPIILRLIVTDYEYRKAKKAYHKMTWREKMKSDRVFGFERSFDNGS